MKGFAPTVFTWPASRLAPSVGVSDGGIGWFQLCAVSVSFGVARSEQRGFEPLRAVLLVFVGLRKVGRARAQTVAIWSDEMARLSKRHDQLARPSDR